MATWSRPSMQTPGADPRLRQRRNEPAICHALQLNKVWPVQSAQDQAHEGIDPQPRTSPSYDALDARVSSTRAAAGAGVQGRGSQG
eukprot:CAMPEP_0171263220 /NCGR_PEP_ID=MMETSP0790-20130122/56983_1 /TAXON_ID=2925 /ORGANISM="Alexandrium catenella, Strain OF101" /LENGTH=85 /DNA_ID=CAMNT_0011731823 /DNA_START=1 /DNA_END=254 /DNA_ORIENTATION=+